MANASIQTIELPKKARALDTSGNNNHGQIYSGRGLEFDGVSDHCTFTTSETFEEFTVVAWVYVNAISDRQNIWDGSDAGSYISIDDAATGQYDLQWYIGSEGSPSGWQQGGIALNINTWYRVVFIFKKNGSAGDYKAYVNGVEDTTGSFPVEAGGNFTSGTFNGFGSVSSGNSRFLDGMMSDMQIWDTSWSTDDVTYDYLNPESLALNRGGTSLTNSNLKLWYPMQDGHRGQQSYILDGANTGLGDELITDGNFPTGTAAWSFANSTTTEIEENKAVITSGGSNAKITTQVSGTSGDVVKVTFNISDEVSSGLAYVRIDGTDIQPSGSWVSGDTTVYYTLVSSGSQDLIFMTYSTATASFTLKDVSVKTVNDKNHATTVFYGDEMVLGDDLDFDTVGNWSGQGATLSSEDDGGSHTSVLKILTTSGDLNDRAELAQSDLDTTTVAGRSYRCTFDYRYVQNTSMSTNGGISIGNTLTSDVVYTNTSWTAYDTTFVAADNSTAIRIYANISSGASGNILYVDNFSIKEIGTASGWTDADQQLDIPQTALQSYNQLAWFSGQEGADATLDSQIDTGANSWSFSFWMFNFDDSTAIDWIIGSSSALNLLIDNATDRKLYYRDGDNVYNALSDAVIPQGEWVHIVVTAIGDTSMTAYINGEAQTTNTAMAYGGSDPDTQLLVDRFMEGYSAGDHEAPGCITEISYYNDVLTQAEVNDLYNDGKAKSALEASGNGNLVHYWRNNGLAEWKDLTDPAGTGNNANTNGVTETLLLPAGVDASRDNQGFLMNRQKDTNLLNLPGCGKDTGYLSIPAPNEDLQFGTSAFSIDFWLKRPQLINEDIEIISSYKDSNESWAMYLQTDHDFVFIAETSNTIRIQVQIDLDLSGSDNATADNDWRHYVFTCEREAADPSSKLIWYIDGEAFDGTYEQRLNTTSDIDIDSSSVQIGRKSSDEATEFQIDDVKIYSDVLSAPEVKRNYNAGKGSHRN